MTVANLSITIDEADLRWVKAEAKRLKSSVSAVVSEALAQRRALRGQERYLKACRFHRRSGAPTSATGARQLDGGHRSTLPSQARLAVRLPFAPKR
jgi:hypothetical protein